MMGTLLDKKTRRTIEKVLQGVNAMPSSVKEKIISDWTYGIDKNRAKTFLDSDLDFSKLKENELYLFFRNLYNFCGIEEVNPFKLDLSPQKNKEEKAKVESEYKKDNDNTLYYDFDFKHLFVTKSKYRESTARVIKALFRRTAEIEKTYNKDLYDFNIKELGEALANLKATTIRSLQNSISTIEQYIDFAYKEGRLEYRVNLANAFDSKDKIEKFLDKEAVENMIFNKEEIMSMAEESDNAQDGVILALLFDGVSHKDEFNELVNLTKDNIDFENKQINLEDRTLPMSQETYLLVNDAIRDEIYYSINGDSVRKYKIAESEYILRGLRNKLKVKGQIISQRILRIAKQNDYEHLNATNVSYSGQIDYARELISKGVNIDDAIDKVLHRFGVPINHSSQWYLKTRLERYL